MGHDAGDVALESRWVWLSGGECARAECGRKSESGGCGREQANEFVSNQNLAGAKLEAGLLGFRLGETP